MKYPKKRYVQGVRPAHIVFSEFLLLEDAGGLPASLKVERSEDVVDGECFPRQEGVSKYEFLSQS
jgi:hypothetical protein